jgi:flagellar biosynthesis activator protein FlaF
MYGARAAYRAVQNTTNYGRELEAAVLTRAARELKLCQDRWNAPDRTQRLDDALRLNQRVWAVFQAELTEVDHPLPKSLRQDILSLAAFVDRRILEVLAHPAAEKLSVIININLNLAAGLQRQG